LEALRRLTSDLDLSSWVTFAGFLAPHQVRDAYGDADVYVSGSVQEGFSIALLEALSSGVPVVGFDVGGITEVVRQGCTGWVVDKMSSEDLANGVARLLPVDETMREECRSVAKAYSSERIASRVMSVLQGAARGMSLDAEVA
jgi:glycosyltransferase involved in cell wall biosynthesis